MAVPPETAEDLLRRYAEGDRSFARISRLDIRDAKLSGADLSDADLSSADLRHADLSDANLTSADLSDAELQYADIRGADLSRACLFRARLFHSNLLRANLSGANLAGANFNQAELRGADLRDAKLQGAFLGDADLSGADFRDANLGGANLSRANLSGADFASGSFFLTVLGGLDLSKVRGLDKAHFDGPSHLSAETLRLSRGAIPKAFLEGCGLQDWEIISVQLYDPTLTHDQFNDIQYKAQVARMGNPIQIGGLFISYSHADSKFVDALQVRLRQKGIRFWRDTHQMLAGRMERQVDRAIRLHDQVVLILSSDSVTSDWVEHEVRRAREKEKAEKRDVLCPIALDDAWKTAPWPARLMEQVKEYNILDFSRWWDRAAFDDAFAKLLAGLAIFYKPGNKAP